MRRMASILLLLGCTSGCIFTHTWELQTYPSWIAGKNRPYEIVQEGGVYYTMSWLETKYEHHIFTDKAGFTYDSELNPLIWVPQLPFIWLCEVPFRWLWEDYYAYRVPVKVDKRIRDKRYCRSVNRKDYKVQSLKWMTPEGVENEVKVSLTVVDGDGLSAEARLSFWKGTTLSKEIVLEPTLQTPEVFIDTFDGRHLYIWDGSSRATYLYRYYRWNGGGRTSWCPALLELDLETGELRRLVWIEYNKLYHADEVVMDQYKDFNDLRRHTDIKKGEVSDKGAKAKD